MIIRLLQNLIHAYCLLLALYALLTWFPGALRTRFGRLVASLAEPYLSYFDRWIPSIGGVSFSVVVGILVLELAASGLALFL